MSHIESISTEDLVHEMGRRLGVDSSLSDDQVVLLKELVSVNNKLLEVEKVKSGFLSNIRNEIVNPLTSILGLSKNLAAHSEDPSKAKLIYEETFQLDFQLKNIFAAADLESGTMVTEINRVDVDALLKQIIQRFSHLSEKRDISVHYSSTIPEGHRFATDAGKLGLIFSNLLANAIKFSFNNGKVEVSLAAQDNDLVIKVKDHGVGIAEDEQFRIFDRFEQVNTGSQKSHLGHGLGLAITNSLLEVLNGEIELESEENKGSTFILRLSQLDTEEVRSSISRSENEFLFDTDEMLF